jgi:phosphoribosylformimino-5-aminoimidazole carboxamide ribotide isomerase
MIILPAVDILDGKCVRLYQGRLDSVKVYADDPVEMAMKWKENGTEWLHVVDLNGAVAGEPKNLEKVREIVEKAKLKVQFGGGIRDMVTLDKVFNSGVDRVVFGTTIITHPEIVAEACLKYDDSVAAAVDARAGKVAVSGWKEGTEYPALQIVDELKVLGISRLVYTDITADGTLRGINFEGVREVCGHAGMPVIYSGGVSSLKDIEKLKELEPAGVEGVIIGTALYEGTIDLIEAIRVGAGAC